MVARETVIGREQGEALFLHFLIVMTKEKVGWVLGLGESSIEVHCDEVMAGN